MTIAVQNLLSSIRDDAHICSAKFIERHIDMVKAVAPDDLRSQVDVFAKDVLLYAAEEAWVAIDWLASLFGRLINPNQTLRCPLIFWATTDGLFAICESIAMHRRAMSYSQIRQIVLPVLIRCEKNLCGLITTGHNLDGDVIMSDIIQATYNVSAKFNRLRDALCDGVYQHSVYDAIKAFKTLKQKWEEPFCDHPHLFCEASVSHS